MFVRPYEPRDAQAVSHIVRRNLMEVNIRDYPQEHMVDMAAHYDAAKVQSVADRGHMYVVCRGETVLGAGAVCPKEGCPGECELLTVFVLPDCQGQGVGRLIMEALEADELFLAAHTITIPASLTAHGFYARFGYGYEGGAPRIFDNENYHMEKHRPQA